MTLRFLLLVLTLLLSGCITYQPHAWTRSLPRASASLLVPPDKISAVHAEQRLHAVRLLDQAAYVLLDEQVEKQLASKQIQKSAAENAFLVRGVSWSLPPLFREVYADESTRTLYVDSYTYSGEIFIPGKRSSEPSPVIVYLTFTPSVVVPDAILGGDRILARSFRKNVWKDESRQK